MIHPDTLQAIAIAEKTESLMVLTTAELVWLAEREKEKPLLRAAILEVIALRNEMARLIR